MVSFCLIWIPHFGVIAKPLHETSQAPETETLKWIADVQESLNALKLALIQAPALGISDLRGFLFIHFVPKRQGVTM